MLDATGVVAGQGFEPIGHRDDNTAEQPVKTGLCAEVVAPVVSWCENDSTRQHALEHRAAPCRGLAQQSSPLSQSVFDEDGKKYVLGVRSGASENATVTTALLEDLVARGIRPDRRRLFVVDGAKALRSAIAQVFGAGNEVQRCRNHKLRNVVGHLPNAQHDQARATLRAAWKLEAKEGMRKLDQYASWLQRDWPDAAASVREGLDEIFTVNRLGLPASLRTCLTTTNIIDSTHSGIRQRTRRVTNWKNGEMALRWSAVAFVETEKNYRRITGYEHLWMLKAHLDRDDDNIAEMQKVG